jgi:hypothetical protein
MPESNYEPNPIKTEHATMKATMANQNRIRPNNPRTISDTKDFLSIFFSFF